MITETYFSIRLKIATSRNKYATRLLNLNVITIVKSICFQAVSSRSIGLSFAIMEPVKLYVQKFLIILMMICISTEGFARDNPKVSPAKMEEFIRNPHHARILNELKKVVANKSITNWSDRGLLPDYNEKTADEKNKELSKSKAEILKKNTAETAGNVANTMITISVIALYAGIRERKRENDKYSLTDAINDDTLWGNLSRALTSGNFWAGFLSSSASSVVVQQGTKMFSKILSTPVSANAFKKLLSSYAFSAGTFLAWEAGGQLWEESRLLLDNSEEYKNSDNFFVMATALMNPNSDAKTKALSRKLFHNMFTIVFTDSDLRNHWLYNVFRLRVATGDFITMVSFMWAGAEIGSGLFPGAGTVFGIAFGIIAYELPQKYKDKITKEIKWTRMEDARGGLRGDMYRMKKITNSSIHPGTDEKVDILAMKAYSYLSSAKDQEQYPKNIPYMGLLLSAMDSRAAHRGDYLGILFEIINWYEMQVEKLEQEKDLYQRKQLSTLSALVSVDLDKDIQDDKKQIRIYSKHLMTVVKNLENFYSEEWMDMKSFNKVLAPYKNQSTDLSCLERTTSAHLESIQIAAEYRIVNLANSIKKYILTDYYPEFKDATIEEDFETAKGQLKSTLSTYYYSGFDETEAVDEVLNFAIAVTMGKDVQSYVKSKAPSDFCSIRLDQKRNENHSFIPPSFVIKEVKKIKIPIFNQ